MPKAETTIQARLKVRGEKRKGIVLGYLKIKDRGFGGDCKGRADRSTDRNLSAEKFPREAPYNLWRVLRVAWCGWRPEGRGLTTLSPDPFKVPRCGSSLKSLLVSGDKGRTLKRREILLPGAGSMAGEIAPAGFIPSLNRRDINSPAPELCKTA